MANVDISGITDYRSLLNKYIEAKARIAIYLKCGLTLLDAMIIDTSDEKVVKIIAKHVANTGTIDTPTFDDKLHISRSGLVEYMDSYDKIAGVLQFDMDKDNDLLQKMKKEYPGYFNYWNNANKVEGCVF